MRGAKRRRKGGETHEAFGADGGGGAGACRERGGGADGADDRRSLYLAGRRRDLQGARLGGGEDARTLPRLQSDPRYATFYDQALAIASAKDRIPMPEQRMGRITNFWRDADHPQGLWRWTTPPTPSATPTWKTLLDLDALSKAEGRKWVWKGATCLQPEERRCLVALSEGGEDALTYREFDLVDARFVEGGSVLPTSKQGADWRRPRYADRLARLGAGTLTASSYPFVVKTLKRGQPLSAAQELYRGQPTDQLGDYGALLTDDAGNRQVIVMRRSTFFGGETFAQVDGRLVNFDLRPASSPPVWSTGRWSLHQRGVGEGAGSHDARSPRSPRYEATLVRRCCSPGPRQSVDAVTVTRKAHVIASIYYDNVRGRALVFRTVAASGRSARWPCPTTPRSTWRARTEAFGWPLFGHRLPRADDLVARRYRCRRRAREGEGDPARFDASNAA
ncbi:hypothetical protein AB5I41_05675 [Sphingomonas sp. MMS24-JH45]